MLDLVRAEVGQSEVFVPDASGSSIVRFAYKAWASLTAYNVCPEHLWTHSRRNLLFEVKSFTNSERIALYLVLGPSAAKIRGAIYNECAQQPKSFPALTKPMGKLYNTIYLRDLIDGKTASGKSIEEKREIILSRWNEFVEIDLSKLNKNLFEIAIRVEPLASHS